MLQDVCYPVLHTGRIFTVIFIKNRNKTYIKCYLQIDHANLNSRISLLYAAYLVITDTKRINANSITNMVSCVFDRLFSETRLNLPVDYRELWLLENSLCILIDFYIDSCTESRI